MSYLILKVVREDMTSHDGFKWPKSGQVAPEKWDPAPECGNGLHGWLNGEGSYRHTFMEGQWLVFSASEVVSLDGGDKVKANSSVVLFVGSRAEAVKYLIEHSALTKNSNPGWCCFGVTQLQELAYRAATRAVKKHAPGSLRKRGREDLAMQLEALPDITNYASALRAKTAANAANAYAADAADAAAYAADAYAANAAYAAYAAAYAADAATDAATDAANAEREEQRLDKLELLGFKVRG